MTIRESLNRLLSRPPWDFTEGGFVAGDSSIQNDSWSRFNSAVTFGAVEDIGMRTKSVGENLMLAADAEYDELHNLYPREPIDHRILSMMRAVEWFTDRRGDVWQIMTAPLDIGLKPPIIMHADAEVKKLYNDEYERLGVRDILAEMWLACEQYGQAYPVIVPQKETEGGDVKGVAALTLLNPKHVAVGRAIQPTYRSLSYTPPKTTREALLQTRDSLAKTVEEHQRRSAQDMFFFTMSEDWNEWIEKDMGFRLDSKYVTHIHHRKQRHQRYAIPPAARALDDMSTRLVLDEMIRATIEGVHTQWRVWRIENPKRGEVAHLGTKLAANRRERTADMVWDGRLLPPDVVMPDSIDALLASETWWRLTLSIYRQLGMFIRIVSGESPSKGSSSDAEIDVQILIARLEYQQERSLAWLRQLNTVIANANGVKELPTVSFMPIQADWEAKLRGVVPLLNFGLVSLETIHNWIGLDPDKEIKRLKSEKPLREDGTIQPYTGFAQSGPSGVAQSPQSPGRPSKPSPETSETNRQNRAQASVPVVPDEYMRQTLHAFDLMVADATKDMVDAFVETVISLRTYRTQAFEIGYLDASGLDDLKSALASDRHGKALAFDDENLLRFRNDLHNKIIGKEQFTGADRNRAGMYAVAGWRTAYMAGVFEAKFEQGFSGWQRIPNWNGSNEGPCPDCIADSAVIHPITEQFWDHPNGVCNAKTVLFSRVGDSGIPLPFRVPTYLP